MDKLFRIFDYLWMLGLTIYAGYKVEQREYGPAYFLTMLVIIAIAVEIIKRIEKK